MVAVTEVLAAAQPRRAAPAGAVVLGADYRALGVVRSLGRHGIATWVLRDGDDRLATLSRYARGHTRWGSGDDANRLRTLFAIADAQKLDGWALFPSGDESAAFVARNHEQLAQRFTLTTPPWSVLRWAYDKRLTAELADGLGVAQPRTDNPRSLAAARAFDGRFPAVLKPAVKQVSNRFTNAKAWRVDDRQSLLARYEEAARLVDPAVLIVQELVPGGGEMQVSLAALADDGRMVAALTARRTRQYPADFGRASTFVETIDIPELVEPAGRLIEAMGFTGLIELEFKLDARDGMYKLLDLNPRVWGWHSLCAAAGVDFPYLLWRLVSGEPVSPTSARNGVAWLRFTTDAPTALKEIARGRLSPRAYLRSLRLPRESAIAASDDPLPGACELPLLAGMLAKRLLRGGGV